MSISKMYDYICETPDVLKYIMDNCKTITYEFVDKYKNANIEQIYLLGSGTSFHASVNAKKYLEEILNVKVYPMYPTHFERNEKILNKNTLVVGISQGGQSLSTVAGLDAAKKQTLMTAAVSENPNALIFEHADTKTRIEVGNEKCGAKTKGFAGTTLTLIMMFTELALAKNIISEEKVNNYFCRINNVIANMPNVISVATNWYENIKDDFKNAKRVIVVGYDNNYGDVLEGALKILETIREGVAGYDIEEFFHGIYNSITEESYIFYLASNSDYKERTSKLIEILSEWTPHNYWVGSPEENVAYTDKDCVVKFTEDDLFGNLEYIIPMQIVACRASQDLGINPDIPKDPNFHARIGSKKLDGVRDVYVAIK
ncbi:MAG: SIS domain-containing protein [Erysipelotrichaceae bacterium]|nr:SIS domain-containing protein [Erysipelotrichaceae bacterium]MDY5252745.1 SIS domain-containing protein [Erysipelotrichaceae bacterium]